MKLWHVIDPRYSLRRPSSVLAHLRWRIPDIQHLRFLLASHGLRVTANERRLASLKNCHTGQRCFIIGNGPSLKISDLEKLENEITFASNQIFVAFEETDWRPTYYTVVDRVIGKNFSQEITEVQAIKLLPDFLRGVVKPDQNTIFYYHDVKRDAKGKYTPAFSTNALERVYGGHTITYINMQLAFYMGIRIVCLIGVDHNYAASATQSNTVKPGDTIAYQGEQSHFHPDYFQLGQPYIVPDFAKHEESYLEAQRVYERHGGRICNATRGGKLENFPRADLDELLVTKDLPLLGQSPCR